MGGGFRGAMKGKRELEEHSAELTRLAENVESSAHGVLVSGGSRGLVGEALPEFGGEEERRICGYAFDPAGGVVRTNRQVEGGIDLDGVKKLGEKSCFVKVF